jgi:hypothetical protein
MKLADLQWHVVGPFWLANIKAWQVCRIGEYYATMFSEILIHSNVHSLPLFSAIITFQFHWKTGGKQKITTTRL